MRHPAFRRGHEQVGSSRDRQAGAALLAHFRLTQILLELGLESLIQLLNLLMQRQRLTCQCPSREQSCDARVLLAEFQIDFQQSLALIQRACLLIGNATNQAKQRVFSKLQKCGIHGAFGGKVTV